MENQIQFRQAHKDNLNMIIQMLANDPLGAKRERNESPLPQGYINAFESIDKDPNNALILAILKDEIVGVL